MKKVVIIQRGISKHRLPFYEKLRKILKNNNIHLCLIQGHFSEYDNIKKDFGTVGWAIIIKNRVVTVFGKELYWQPALRYALSADLVIVEQANRLLLNYILLMLQRLSKFKLAFWGHGRNFQVCKTNSLPEKFKSFYSTKVNWWFAYNDLSANILTSLGYPQHKITSVQNAIDTQSLIAAKKAVSQHRLDYLRNELGIRGTNVCIYVGGMYPEKRIPFLLEACGRIKEYVSDFEMILIGSGPDTEIVKTASKKFQWIHYVGPMYGKEKVPYFLLAKLFLIPGSIGLAVLDAFAMETPIVTTNVAHGPEIDYLLKGINGVIVTEAKNSSAYAAKVSSLLRNEGAREKLIAGCRAASEKYTIEEMVQRFAWGVVAAMGCD